MDGRTGVRGMNLWGVVAGLFFLSLVVWVIVSMQGRDNASSAQTPSVEVSADAAVTKEEYQLLRNEVGRLGFAFVELRREVEAVPDFLLRRLDRDLDAASKGENPKGSFTDYFVPNAQKALESGAAKKDVVVRLERAVALAEKGIYLSSGEADFVKEGGVEAVRSYIENSLKEWKIVLSRR